MIQIPRPLKILVSSLWLGGSLTWTAHNVTKIYRESRAVSAWVQDFQNRKPQLCGEYPAHRTYACFHDHLKKHATYRSELITTRVAHIDAFVKIAQPTLPEGDAVAVWESNADLAEYLNFEVAQSIQIQGGSIDLSETNQDWIQMLNIKRLGSKSLNRQLVSNWEQAMAQLPEAIASGQGNLPDPLVHRLKGIHAESQRLRGSIRGLASTSAPMPHAPPQE